MALSDVASVSITSNTSALSLPGFGTPLIAAYHSVGGSVRVKTYSSDTALDSMVTDGHLTTSPVYAAASIMLAANPRPERIKIGRRANAFTHVFTLKCLSATQGDVYGPFTINGTSITYTVLASATTTTVATAIAALLTAAAASLYTVGTSTDTITVTNATAGKLTHLKDWGKFLKFTDTTADVDLTADLAAMKAEDPDWYGFTLDTCSKADITDAAAWSEANEKIFASHSCDTADADNASTTDVMYTEKALAHARAYLQYNANDTWSYGGSAILGSRLPATPGSDTWAYKTLPSVPVDHISDTEEAAVIAKNGNVYVPIYGRNITRQGISPAGEYLDVVRFRDWLKTTMAGRVFAHVSGSEKIPYTDLGVDSIVSIVDGVLQEGVRVGGLVKGSIVITTIPVADVSTVDRAARAYGGISWTARLAGAIHKLTIRGTITV